VLSVTGAIDQFLAAIALDVKPATVVYYRRSLAPLRAIEANVGQVTLGDLRAVYGHLRNRDIRYAHHPTRPAIAGGLSAFTLHKHVRAWKRFFNWLVEEEVIPCNPAAKLKRPRLPRVAPKDMLPEDLERLLNQARANQRDYAIVCFLADTACRVGGLAGLKLGDVRLDDRRALVREKGDRERFVHFGERTATALQIYCEGERNTQLRDLERRGIDFDPKRVPPKDGDFVFLGKQGSLTTSGVYLAIKRLARAAGVQGRYNPHSIRHGWARAAIKRGASLKEIQEILGHASVMTTATSYAVYLDEEIHERHGQLSWLREE
jgi:site-specific recombinase XerD